MIWSLRFDAFTTGSYVSCCNDVERYMLKPTGQQDASGMMRTHLRASIYVIIHCAFNLQWFASCTHLTTYDSWQHLWCRQHYHHQQQQISDSLPYVPCALQHGIGSPAKSKEVPFSRVLWAMLIHILCCAVRRRWSGEMWEIPRGSIISVVGGSYSDWIRYITWHRWAT